MLLLLLPDMIFTKKGAQRKGSKRWVNKMISFKDFFSLNICICNGKLYVHPKPCF